MEYADRVLSRDQGPADRRFEQIIGDSPALESVLADVERVAPTDSTVLVLGETGTGKELIARAIHNVSTRCGRPFVKLNCAAIPFDLLESELFGHERGAFTGAIAQRIGRFEMADTGTLFLDEIGDLPLALQPKLLRVLQEHEFERVGSGRTQHIDVRVVAATHRNLLEMLQRNEFRSDLYYRLNVFPISLPPLRDRREDIEQLVAHFVEAFSSRMKKRIDHIPDETLTAFVSYSWPGNIRELQNLVERSVILSNDGVLSNPFASCCASSFACKPAVIHGAAAASAPSWNSTAPSVPHATLLESQRVTILQALNAAGWVIGGPRGAAVRLGLKRTTLITKMRKFGISKPALLDGIARLPETSQVPHAFQFAAD